MKTKDIARILESEKFGEGNDDVDFTRLLTDSRQLVVPSETLFFAIRSKRNDGVKYVADLYDKGVRGFVVSRDIDTELRASLERKENIHVWYVDNVVFALQNIASAHRQQFDIPVVGITGSNGKTIVKDWMLQLLSPDRRMVVNPKSYNSQIGVPLSVWLMNDSHEMGVFEAGISQPGEMSFLENVIRPTIGVFTNIGHAHDEGFESKRQKIEEKLRLFEHCNVIIYCSDYDDIKSAVENDVALNRVARFEWGRSNGCTVQLCNVESGKASTKLTIGYDGKMQEVSIPFVDKASIENAMHCISLMLYLGYDSAVIAQRCAKLTAVAMRMEVDEGINNCVLINDSYSLDINSLSIALDYMQQDNRYERKTLILSDFVQSGGEEEDLYSQVAELIERKGIVKLIAIGDAISRNRRLFDGFESYFYRSTEEFLSQHPRDNFHNEAILLKGARVFGFENIAKVLNRHFHETVMEVNLGALIHNANYYRARLSSGTKLMAMVKASSYGAGKVEVANALQYNHVDYLTVAYCDEGVELRKNGITLPIMVMNPEEDSFENIIRYDLEPDIYSFRILKRFSEAANTHVDDGKKIKIHVELDTGMHRLGFALADVERIAETLRQEKLLDVKSVFSHLACSEDPEMDDFTRMQIESFREGCKRFKQGMGRGDIMCHILNSSGIIRFPEAQMDMVRLGIGLYGISPEESVQQCLLPVSTLKTRISQIKNIPCGDTVGYNRRWKAQRDSRIAIIPIGYADGLSRLLGHGRGVVSIDGCEAPIVGSVCMDMCFVDVTDIQCYEGGEVVIFSSSESLKNMALAADTIPYEILTSVSPRVKRVYVTDN